MSTNQVPVASVTWRNAPAGRMAAHPPCEVFLMTANIASIFEKANIASLTQSWVAEVGKAVQSRKPKFVGINFQEVGGKSSKFVNTQKVLKQFLWTLETHMAFRDFDRVYGFVDTLEKSGQEDFTALGQLFFVHNDLEHVARWNHATQEYVPIADQSTHDVSVAKNSDFHKKHKFAVGEFGWNVPSRKGFVHSKWRLSGKVLNVVALHLFHDVSNLVTATPGVDYSPYAHSRAEAVRFILEAVESSDGGASEPAPLSFFCGDFNFRLSLGDALLWATKDGGGPPRDDGPAEAPTTRSYFVAGSDEPAIVVGPKKFVCADTKGILLKNAGSLRSFDKELKQFPSLKEFSVSWRPSYPCDDGADTALDACAYNLKRAPAWPDRILMTAAAHKSAMAGSRAYKMVGDAACMGDHKPVYLHFSLL